MNEHARINAFQAWLDSGAAEEVAETPAGRFFSTPSFPVIWDLNYLRVEREGFSPEEIEALVARMSDERGLGHRKVICNSQAISAAMSPHFDALEGWSTTTILEMVLKREPDRPGAVAEEVAWDEFRAFRVAVAERSPYADSAPLDVLVDKGTRWNAAGAARHFVMKDDGRIVAGCDLFTDGKTAQIEEVDTLEEARGKGHARAIVATAAAAAMEAGAELIFILADDDDWPKGLYTKLGFDPVGTHREFLKRPREMAP